MFCLTITIHLRCRKIAGSATHELGVRFVGKFVVSEAGESYDAHIKAQTLEIPNDFFDPEEAVRFEEKPKRRIIMDVTRNSVRGPLAYAGARTRAHNKLLC